MTDCGYFHVAWSKFFFFLPAHTFYTKSNALTCYGQTAKIDCHNYGKIRITKEKYGYWGKKSSCNTNAIGNGYVESDQMAKACNGKHSCSIKISTNLFGIDPIVGQNKYAEYSYQCYCADSSMAGDRCEQGKKLF